MHLKLTALAASVALATLPLPSLADNLPTNPRALFAAEIQTATSSRQLIVETTTDNPNTVIKWDSFNIGEGYTVIFDNHNYLNLVSGKSKSIIDGSLYCYGGNIFIVNPYGITASKSADIHVGSTFGLSTASIDDEAVRHFKNYGVLANTGEGIGKIRLLGEVHAANLYLDGSQIIIRDADAITDYWDTSTPLTGENVQLASSTGRVDIGASEDNDTDYASTYTYLERDGGYEVVNHSQATAVSTADEFLAMEDDHSYWLTDDLDLGDISGLAATEIKDLELDGAYNSITYSLDVSTSAADEHYGLFGTISDSFISNLRIKDATIHIDATAGDTRIGGLAGTLNRTQLSNVAVEDLSVEASADAIASGFEFGGMAGYASASELTNLTATLLEECEKTLVKSNLTFGTLFHDVSSNTTAKGVISGHSFTGEAAAVAGGGNTFTAYNNDAEAIADYQESYADFDEYFVTSTAGDRLRQKGFLMPYSTTTVEETYDGTAHSYPTDDDTETDKYTNEVYGYAQSDIVDFTTATAYTEAGEHNVGMEGWGDLNGELYFVNNTTGTASSDSNAYVNITKQVLTGIVVSDVTLSSADEEAVYSIANEDDITLSGDDTLAALLEDGLYFETYEEDGVTYITLRGETTNYTLDPDGVTAGVLTIISVQDATTTDAGTTTPAVTDTTTTSSDTTTAATADTTTTTTTTASAATASSASAVTTSGSVLDTSALTAAAASSDTAASATVTADSSGSTFAIDGYAGLSLDNENPCSFCRGGQLAEPRRTPATLDVEGLDGSVRVANSTLDDDDDDLLA